MSLLENEFKLDDGMSWAENFHAQHKIRLAKIARAAENPKPKRKPVPILYATRGFKEPRPQFDVLDPVDERAWMLEIEGFTPVNRAGELRISDIVSAVGKHFGLARNELLSARRNGHFVGARMVAYYLCRRLTKKSYPEIGRRLGDRDHTTILHGYRQVEVRMRNDIQMQASVEMLVAQLGGDIA